MKRALLTAILGALWTLPIGAEEINTEGLTLSNIKASIGQTVFREKGACVGLTVKNDSQHTYIKVKVLITFLDRDGKAFFEETRFPVLWSGFTGRGTPLKPNYSVKMKPLCTTDGIELERWDEGKVQVRIIETETKAEWQARQDRIEENRRKMEELRKKMDKAQ